jgi:D-alanine--poly(phosphoribitol) ligase subunit 1
MVDPENCVGVDDPICLFYTSGSTGVPKGVVITRRNVQAMVDWWYPISNLNINSPRMLNFTPYGFSSSLATIYNGLGMLGATLYAVDKKLAADYPSLFEFILKVDPHYFDCTPSFADVCLLDPRFSSDGLPSMRQLTVGGEPCSHHTGELLLERFPKSQIINGYGATETTIGTIACEITMDMVKSAKPIPIGYPSQNSHVYIMDDLGNKLPDGEAGELVIVSDMITAGYFKDSERTAKYYFVEEDGTRGYHTRDLARIENGLVYYIGRMDNMVKVGGYRVEMEEVERYLSQVSIIAKCAVAPVEDDQRITMLVAYVVLKPEAKKGIQVTITIKREMSKWVQGYMIPQKIVFIDKLPYNSNDKIDRNLLREMSKQK